MSFHCQSQCDALGPVLSEKSELNAAKAMERIANGQGNPVNPNPVSPLCHGGEFKVGDFTAPRY
jgi:hypothetical protein